MIASTLLGVHPPALPARVLVRSGELFGMQENATRVALSRMVAAGEVEAIGDEASSYRLAGHLLERQARQDVSRRPPRPRRWRGDWHLAVVTTDRRSAAERSALRNTMARARFVELREGVWTRPDNLDRPRDDLGCTWARARFEEPPADLWDLAGWVAGAHRLITRLRDDLVRLEREGVDALGASFVLSASVLRHLQADPLLPAELLPGDWPGDELRSTYDDYDARFSAVWSAWHRSLR